MPRAPAAKRLEDLRAQKAKVEKELRAVEARLLQQRRKDDTRRKILMGAAVMEALAHGATPPEMKAWLKGELDRFTRKPADRKLLEELLVT